MNRHVHAALVALCALSIGITAQAQPGRRRALLIGINDYSASRLGTPRVAPALDRQWANLQGAVNDAEGLREMLVGLYGFEERDVVLLTDQQATRANILQKLQQHLLAPAAKDDVLVFFYAGHGSRVRNSGSDEPDRMDESLVPADSRLGVRDIRDKELRPLFNAMLDRGARLTVILDNCFSGSGARGLITGGQARGIKADERDVADRTRYGPRPDERGALVLSATQDFERADETRDEQKQWHGNFSLALLRAIRDAAGGESAAETFLRARARMRGETPFQEPVMAGNAAARLAPLFGTRSDRSADRTIVAVERVLADGTVVLQGGWASGLTVGSELRPISDRNLTARLRVTNLLGLGRSEARIEPGRTLPLSVKPGATLEVAGWAAPPGRPLKVWAPRLARNADAIAALARRLVAEAARRGVRWINDPLDTTPTHLLRRTSTDWELLDSAGRIQRFGPDPGDAVAALARVPARASLFVQLPAPATFIDVFDGVAATDDAHEADYVLTGRFVYRRLEYAWVRPGVVASDRRKTGLPLRSDWIANNPRALRDAVLRLRRIHAWNQLTSPPGERSAYHLALRRTTDGLIAKDSVTGDEPYELVLRAAAQMPGHVPQRYVYVFAIDSHGASTLLFPRGGSVENRLPLAMPAPREIRLGQAGSFDISAPYGVDTYFLLSTDEALPDPWILEWDGVRTRSPQAQTALEELLLQTDSSNRGKLLITPSSWSIDKTVFESVAPRVSKKRRR